jgi:hypothetical protein
LTCAAQPAKVDVRYRPSYEEIADDRISSQYRRTENEMIVSRHESQYISQTMAQVELEKKVQKLSNLATDWDSYGSEPPSSASIALALEIGAVFIKLGLTPDVVVPSSEGGVALCFIRDKKYADVEFFNSGSVVAVRHSPQDDPIAWSITSDNAAISSAVKIISQFLSV